MRIVSLFLGILCTAPASAIPEAEFRGIEWLEKYRDAEGCIPLKQLEEKGPDCPEKVEPQIRPMTIGTLNREKTKSRKKKDLCCFDWRTLGNR